MRTIQKTVYKFLELSPEAQEDALNEYREGHLDSYWWDDVYETVVTAANMLGIDIDHKPNKPNSPCIFFSGFYHQGQGSSFEGNYAYRKGSLADIKNEFPKDTELHRIAKDLMEAQKANRYQVTARIRSSRDTSIKVDCDVEAIVSALESFNHWIFSCLEREYEWLTSDEQLKESFVVNEYEFYEDGSMI